MIFFENKNIAFFNLDGRQFCKQKISAHVFRRFFGILLATTCSTELGLYF